MAQQTVQIFWIKFDPTQYYTLLQSLHDIKEMIAELAPSGLDQAKVQAVTEKLKQSAAALQAAVDANKNAVVDEPPTTK